MNDDVNENKLLGIRLTTSALFLRPLGQHIARTVTVSFGSKSGTVPSRTAAELCARSAAGESATGAAHAATAVSISATISNATR
jgi:hypothetical protein